MFVFRVENNDGDGPYKFEINSDICNIFGYHRTPQDMGYDVKKEHYFAWSSIDSLKENFNERCRRWFKNDEDWMVSIYEVDDTNVTVLPDGQAMFIKSKSKLIKRVKFGNIYRIKKYQNI